MTSLVKYFVKVLHNGHKFTSTNFPAINYYSSHFFSSKLFMLLFLFVRRVAMARIHAHLKYLRYDFLHFDQMIQFFTEMSTISYLS